MSPEEQSMKKNWSAHKLVNGLLWYVLAVMALRLAAVPEIVAQEQNPKTGQLPAARLDGNYFSRAGHRFIPVGANWFPAKAGLQWPYVAWDPNTIAADFARMHEMGFNTIRLDMIWAWFEPRPDDFNPQAFQQLDFLISLAHRYHIYLHPMLLIGGEWGEAFWDVPYRNGRDPQSDPYMLRLETDFAAEFARRYGKETAILAWDLTDEPPFWISKGTSDSMAINWTRLLSGAIRRYDSLHPLVVGTSGEDVAHGPFRPDNLRDEVDFLSVHPYSMYDPKLFPDPMLSTRQTYGAAFETELSGGAGRPVMVQEIGAPSAQYEPEQIAAFLRADLYSALGAGANGFLIWCYTDAAPEQYQRVPVLRAPDQIEFGLTTWDGKDRPAGRMFEDFEKTVGRLDLAGIKPAPAEAGIIVPNEWSRPYGDASHFGLTGPAIVPYTSTNEGGAVAGEKLPDFSNENQWLTGSWLSSFILSRQAGLKADFPREYADWHTRPLLLLPSPVTATDTFLVHVHSDFWEKVRRYVANGGALYASLCGDAAIPEMEGLFGAQLLDHSPISEVTLKVVVPWGGLNPGETFHYSAAAGDFKQWGTTLVVRGGTVIAVDQDGRPALVANRLGKGATLLCAYPLENYLANRPAAFDKQENTCRIYQAFRDWAGIRARFRSNQPSVEATSLDAPDHGYVVVVNHSAEPRRVTMTSTLPLKSIERVGTEGEQPVSLHGSEWDLSLQPYSAAVFAWR
jgi:endo-1,4-beta-mannosidase